MILLLIDFGHVLDRRELQDFLVLFVNFVLQPDDLDFVLVGIALELLFQVVDAVFEVFILDECISTPVIRIDFHGPYEGFEVAGRLLNGHFQLIQLSAVVVLLELEGIDFLA